jgi:type IV pilus assembly protein PilF
MRLRDAPFVCSLTLAVLLVGGCASGGGMPRKSDIDQKKAAEVQVQLGQGYMAKGDLETARDKLRRALELDPRSADAHTLMAVLHERIDRPQIAEQHYREAAKLKPEDGALANNLAAFLCSGGEYAQAEALFRVAFDDPFYKTPAVAYTNAAVCAAKAGEAERSETYFRKVLELDRGNRIALYALAKANYERGDLLRARAFVQRVEATGMVDADLLDLGARIEDGLGDAATAAEYRRQRVEKFPDAPPAADIDGPKSP